MPFTTEGGGGSGGGSGGAPAGGSGGGGGLPNIDIGRTGNARLLYDPLSQLIALDLGSADDDGAHAQRSTSTATALMWTGGNALTYTITAGGSFERQLYAGGVRLREGTKVVVAYKIYISDTVPVVYVGLFGTNATTGILSSFEDAIYFKRAAGANTTTCEYEYNNGGVQSASAGFNIQAARFNALSIEIEMDQNVAGAGRVTWRIDGIIVESAYYDASTNALTLPYDEPLYPTVAASGNGVIGVMSPRIASIMLDAETV